MMEGRRGEYRIRDERVWERVTEGVVEHKGGCKKITRPREVGGGAWGQGKERRSSVGGDQNDIIRREILANVDGRLCRRGREEVVVH